MKKLEYSSFQNLAKVIVALGVVSLTFQPVKAQITPDNTLSDENSRVTTVSEGEQQIDGGAIRGSNLFHSFSEFNVGENQTVNFANPENIANIFSRVTGNNLSQILGDLGVLGNANLFLINPNGIVFGENASLNVNGSFVATTANSINFADGNKFTANPATEKPLLTINLPNALEFGERSGRIINKAQSYVEAYPNGVPDLRRVNSSFAPAGLKVQPNSTLALIGGEILLEGGNLTASGGKIEIGSVGDNSIVGLSLVESAIIFDYRDITSFTDITVTDRIGSVLNFALDENEQPILDENGQFIIIFSELPVATILDASTSETVGSINIRGKNVDILNGSQIQAFTIGDLPGGDININATGQLTIAGNVLIPAQPIPVPSGIVSVTNGTGNAGNITITTSELLVADMAVISSDATFSNNPVTGEITFSRGNAGNIKINAAESVNVTTEGKIQSETFGTGSGGTISIATSQVNLNSESAITTSTFQTGNAGAIEVIASNFVTISNDSEITSTAEENSVGDAGNIGIQARSVVLDENSKILTSTIQSNGGIINLQLKDNLELRNQSLVSASVGGNGNGGNINISTEFVITSPEDDSDIIAKAEFGDGGNISIDATDVFGISFRETTTSSSDITASSNFGTDGTVNLTNSALQSNRLELDTQVQLIAESVPNFSPDSCYVGQRNKYIQTGRGGVPLAVKSSLVSEYTWEDWRIIDRERLTETTRSRTSSVVVPENDTSVNPVRGWVVNSQGEIVLTDKPLMVIPQSLTTVSPGC